MHDTALLCEYDTTLLPHFNQVKRNMDVAGRHKTQYREKVVKLG